jgi:hypothetical protein
MIETFWPLAFCPSMKPRLEAIEPLTSPMYF